MLSNFIMRLLRNINASIILFEKKYGSAILFMIDFSFRNLGNNVFPHLPSAGLERLLHLKTFNNPNLREFPPPEDFPRIQTLVLAYAYHCCAFLPLIPSNPPPKAKDIIVFPDIDDIDLNIWNSSSIDLWPSMREYFFLI